MKIAMGFLAYSTPLKTGVQVAKTRIQVTTKLCRLQVSPRWLWDSPCPKPTMAGDGFPSNHENGDDLGMVSFFALGLPLISAKNVDVNSR